MKSTLLIVTLLLFITELVNSYVQPEPDGRSYFAVNMGNILELHMKSHSKEQSYSLSPAAVQKSLAIFYNSAEDGDDLQDLMLMEMGLKYFDATRLMETAMAEMTTFEALQEDRFEKLDKPIKRMDVLNFFETDFNELNTTIYYSNTMIIPKSFQLSPDFIEFAKDFFNTSILLEDDSKVLNIYESFALDPSKMLHNAINVYNDISFKIGWKPNFIETANHVITRGNFRYGEIESSEDKHISVRVLELPLQSAIPLSMVLIIPKHKHDFPWTTNYEVIRPITDHKTTSNILKEHLVEVKLPKNFHFKTTTDIIGYLRKSGLTRAKIYEAPQNFKRIFNKPPRNNIGLGQFYQNIEVEVVPDIVKDLPVHHSGFLNTIKEKIIDLTLTENFDVTGKPFLYVVKTSDVIYFMGHSYG